MKENALLINELDNREIALRSMPIYIRLESVKGCPHTCAMCINALTKIQNIPDDLLKKVGPYFKNLDVLAIHGEGEPLLGRLEYFVEQSIKHDFVLHMNTTGFFLTKKIADILLKTRLSIRFSIHAGTSSTYEKIMGNELEKVLENIGYLVKQSKKNNADSDFWFNFLVMKENLDEIDEFLKLARKTGVRHVRFMKLHPKPQPSIGTKIPDGGFKFDYPEQYNPSIAKKFLEKLPYYNRLADELGVRIESGSMEFAAINLTRRDTRPVSLRRRESICIAPWVGQLIIRQGGEVNLCCSLFKYPLGNINNSTLEEIWNCKTVKDFRESFKKGAYPKLCGSCCGVGYEEYPRNSFIYVSRLGKK